jgi:hypothetical protein
MNYSKVKKALLSILLFVDDSRSAPDDAGSGLPEDALIVLDKCFFFNTSPVIPPEKNVLLSPLDSNL